MLSVVLVLNVRLPTRLGIRTDAEAAWGVGEMRLEY